MYVHFVKAGQESGRTRLDVMANGQFRGVIRYFDRCALNQAGSNVDPHWALLHYPSGRVDRFATQAEAKDDARKL